MEQAKAEEIHLFTEMYMDWKGVNNPHLHLPRIYDKVSEFVIVQEFSCPDEYQWSKYT